MTFILQRKYNRWVFHCIVVFGSWRYIHLRIERYPRLPEARLLPPRRLLELGP